MDTIDLRSDTVTLPTEAMLNAMRSAPLGDDVYGEDPTVNQLEKMAADMLGKEAALLVVSGTMGNLVSLMAQAAAGDEVVLDPQSHIFWYEVGGLASVAGLMPRPVPTQGGMLDPDEVAASIRDRNVHHPVPRVFCLENTHNRSGGRVVPLDLHKRLCQVAHERGLSVHLDGARIFNAAIAAGVPASAYAEDVESVMFCLSKGLSCPIGSLITGSAEFVERARHCRKRIGGGMRQAGVIAAAGLVALEQMIDRLSDDHRNARLLAEGVSKIPGLRVDLQTVHTNMVHVDHSLAGMANDEFIARLKEVGVLAGTRPPNHARLVTHRHHDSAVIEDALVRIRTAVGTP